jgi:acyl-[acyl-carrier-protein]-phospholipid O-acyltransferase/long-chain-fatty-acid--[acyl-carrier-protein] ligase
MTARERRAIAGRRLYDAMSAMIFDTSDIDRTLFQALLDAKPHPWRQGAGGRGHQARAADLCAARRRQPRARPPLRAPTAPREAVGVLLPNVTGVVASFFALQAIGRVPAMLNYTAGLANLKAACLAADVRTIVTARAFVTQAKLEAIVSGLEADGRTILYLEDIRAEIGLSAKLRALLGARFAARRHRRRGIAATAIRR